MRITATEKGILKESIAKSVRDSALAEFETRNFAFEQICSDEFGDICRIASSAGDQIADLFEKILKDRT